MPPAARYVRAVQTQMSISTTQQLQSVPFWEDRINLQILWASHVKHDHFCPHLQMLQVASVLQTGRICKVFFVASRLKFVFFTCKGACFHMCPHPGLPQHRIPFRWLFRWPKQGFSPTADDKRQKWAATPLYLRNQDTGFITLFPSLIIFLDRQWFWFNCVLWKRQPNSSSLTSVQQLDEVSGFGTKTPQGNAGSALSPWQSPTRHTAPPGPLLVLPAQLRVQHSQPSPLHCSSSWSLSDPAVETSTYPTNCTLTAYIWPWSTPRSSPSPQLLDTLLQYRGTRL